MPFYILLDTIKPRLFWLTLTTYVYKAIQTLGRKMAESSDFAKKAKKCIFLVDPLWCTVNDSFLCISRRQNLNYIHFFRKLYPHSLNSQDFLHTIIISSRRRSIKTPKKILENYEYTGHNLDTISAWFFRLLGNDFLCFYYALCAFWSQ